MIGNYDKNINMLIDLIYDAWNNYWKDEQRCYGKYFYGYCTDGQSQIEAGLDENMRKYVYRHCPKEIRKNFVFKTLENGRTLIYKKQ